MVWVFLGIILISGAVMVYPLIRAAGEIGKLERDSGWKRVGWGLYKTGPWGGPYVEEDAKEISSPDASAKSTTSGAEGSSAASTATGLSDAPGRPTWLRWQILAAAAVAPIALPVIGGVISGAEGHTPLAGVLIGFAAGFVMIGDVWIVVGVRAARTEARIRRGG